MLFGPYSRFEPVGPHSKCCKCLYLYLHLHNTHCFIHGPLMLFQGQSVEVANFPINWQNKII